MYDMLCRPTPRRLPGGKPRADDHAAAPEAAHFYDLVIEVAIVRPGPIQGDMVHPYLRRRKAKNRSIPHPRTREVLAQTHGRAAVSRNRR